MRRSRTGNGNGKQRAKQRDWIYRRASPLQLLQQNYNTACWKKGMNVHRSGKKGKQTIGRTPVEGFCPTSRFHGQKQQQQQRVAQSEARNQCIILAGATTKTKDTFWARFVPAKTKRPQRFGLTCVGLIHIMQGPCQFFLAPTGMQWQCRWQRWQ